MDIKKILGLTILLLALFSCMSIASAGWFDFFDDGQVENETYKFDGFSVDLPKDARIYNTTAQEDDYYRISYYVNWGNTDDGNNGSIEIDFATGNIVKSTEELVSKVISLGAKSEGYYGDWAILNMDGVRYSENGVLSGYMLTKVQDGKVYSLKGENLTQLKNIADTFEIY